MVNFFLEINDILGRLTAYEVLFRKNSRFSKALCTVFESLLEFCAWSRQKLRSKAKTFAKLLFTDSVKREAALKITQFRVLCIKTESEAQLAGAEATMNFQRIASRYFKNSRKRYKTPGIQS